jgi:hypothetical protein
MSRSQSARDGRDSDHTCRETTIPGPENGIFGLGWNLTLPWITGKADQGIPQHRDRKELDVFLISDADENDRGVDLSKPSEHRRSRSANRYLKRIEYGNETAEWMFEVVFDFGEEAYRESEPFVDTGPAEEGLWPARNDPFSTYRSSFEVRTHRLCGRALLFHHFPEELHTARCLVRSTRFEYREKPIGSLVTRVTQSGYSLESDDRYLRRSMPPLDFGYTAVSQVCSPNKARAGIWMFDLDYPGRHTLTIPRVSGPNSEVHCRLTLLRSATRVDPLLSPPPALCCHCRKNGNGYQACPRDPRVVREYGATEAIATSTGQNEPGLLK